MYQLLSKSVESLFRGTASALAGLMIFAASSAVPHLPFSSPAHAQCVQTGLSVVCGGTDTDGFTIPGPGINDLTVENGAVVNDTTGGSLNAVVDGIGGTVTSFTNNGVIRATNGIRDAVLLSEITTGDFINTGTISADGFGYGVVIGTLNNGIFTSSGTITGDGGVLIGDHTNRFTNSGTINGTSSDAVFINGNMTGNFTNSGAITGAEDGLEITGTATSLTNNGTITGSNFNFGADITNGWTGTFLNSGSITGGTGLGANADANALINSGTISGNDFDGVLITGTLQSLINHGSINGDSNAVEANNIVSLINYGLLSGTDGDGLDVDGGTGTNDETSVITSLVNHGTIRGSDDGIDVGTLTRLVNTGTIIGGYDGRDFSSGIAAAVITEIINSGLIGSGAPVGTEYSIEERGTGDTSLTLLAGSTLIGWIDLGGGTNTLNLGQGLSLNSTFDGDSGGGTLPQLGTLAGHLIAFVDNTALTPNERQIVAVDLSAFGGFEDALSALTSGYGGVIQARQAGLRSGQSNGFSAGDLDGTALVSDSHVWVEGFGAFRHDESDRIGGDFDHLTGGLVAGMDRPLDDVTSIGAMVGFAASTSENEINTQTTNATSFYAGIYGSTQSMGLAWDASLTVGYTDYEAERITANNLVAGGLETARADFGGWFINPQVTATRAASNPWAGQGVHGFVAAPTLEQSLTLSYAGLFLDGYTETGTTNPLTLNDRSVHVASARAAIALPFERTEADGALTTLRLIGGLEARTQFGDDTVSGTLLGQAVRSTLDDDDFDAGAFLGLAGEYQTTSGLTAYAQAEAMLDTDLSYQISASAGLRIAF